MSLIYDALKRLEPSQDGVTSLQASEWIPVHRTTDIRKWRMLAYVVLFLIVIMVLTWQMWSFQMQDDHIVSIPPVRVAATVTTTSKHDDAIVAAITLTPAKKNVKAASVQTENIHSAHPEHAREVKDAHEVKVAAAKTIARQARPSDVGAPTGIDQSRILVHVVHSKSSLQAVADRHIPKADAKDTVRNIVARLRLAMVQGNQSVIDAAMKQLDQRVGMHSLIVLRMHAYRAFKQHKYAIARNYYNQVLALRPDDVEAGSNMALLEWRSGDVVAARKRIRLLRNIHPSSPVLRHYMMTMDTVR